MHDFFFYLLATANLISLAHLGLYVVGANTYDIVQFRNARRKLVAPKGRLQLPLVSVVIPAHNEAPVIRRTLDSVRKSTYSNLEIIVIDDGSTDRTEAIVRDYIARLPSHVMRASVRYASRPLVSRPRFMRPNAASRQLVAQSSAGPQPRMQRWYERAEAPKVRTVRVVQRNAGKAAAMNNAIANYVKGAYTMCLDADSILHPKAIERAVTYFEDPKVIGVAANVRIMESRSFLGTIQRFEHMVGYRSKKFYSLTNSEFIIGGVASTYRTEVLKKVNMYDTDTMTEDIGLSLKLIAQEGNKRSRIVYAADVVAMTEGVQSFGQLLRQRYRWKMGSLQNLFKYRHLIMNMRVTKYNRMLTMYRLPMAILSECLLILQPLLLGYIIYLSIYFQTFGILIGAYGTITLYVLWNVLPDEHLTRWEKARMSALALFIYAAFYVMDIVQVHAIFKCLRNYRRIVRGEAGHTTWVSPTRAGQPAQV